MPKIIRTVCDVLPDEAVLVRSAYLRNNLRASALISEARRRASGIVSQAQSEAENLYHISKSEGYALGIVQAAEALTEYLSDYRALAVQWREKLMQQVATILRSSTNSPDVLMAVFEECLREHEFTEAQIDLLFPESMRAGHNCLMARMESFSAKVKIEYRDSSSFLLRMGDQIIEFSPDEFVAIACARVIEKLSSVYAGNPDIAEKCRERLAALFVPK